MQMLTRSKKPKLGKPVGATYRLIRVIDYWHGKTVVLRYEQVGSPSWPSSIASGSQFTPSYDSIKFLIKYNSKNL